MILNGEIKSTMKTIYDTDNEPVGQLNVKITRVCLKALHVEPLSHFEAIKSAHVLRKERVIAN